MNRKKARVYGLEDAYEDWVRIEDLQPPTLMAIQLYSEEAQLFFHGFYVPKGAVTSEYLGYRAKSIPMEVYRGRAWICESFWELCHSLEAEEERDCVLITKKVSHWRFLDEGSLNKESE